MPTTHIEQSFGRAAERYIRHAAVQRDLARWLSEWAPSLRRGQALELGAGPGVLTEFLLPWKGEYLASDLSSAMCTAGRKRFPDIGWRRAAAENPPPGPWNWIFTSSMLQWVDDPALVLRACRGALAPGGRILAGFFVAPTLPEWERTVRCNADIFPLSWRTDAHWRRAAEQAGLRVLRCESESRTFVYPSAREFLRSLHAVGAAPTRRLPAPALRRALAFYEDHFKEGTQGVRSTWTFCRIEASN